MCSLRPSFNLSTPSQGPVFSINAATMSSNKRDMRRPDLSEWETTICAARTRRLAALTSTYLTVIPYQEPKPKDSNELSSTLSSTMPMAVMLTRNRFIGWYACPESPNYVERYRITATP